MNSVFNRFPIKHKLFINAVRNNSILRTNIYHKINSYRKTNFTKVSFEMIKKAIDDASSYKGTPEEKAVYWDIVHELIVYYHKQQQLIDENSLDEALETYCENDESQPECRMYDI